MFKHLSKITIIALLLFILGGCSMFERQDYEKRISRVSEVYPTEKVSDLFEKFPKGFEIWHRKDEVADEDTYIHEIELQGNAQDKTITGTYKKLDLGHRELIVMPIRYEENQGLVAEQDYQFEPIMQEFRFLFQTLNLNEKTMERLDYLDLSSNPALNTFNIRYLITDSQLNNYLKFPKDTQLEIEFGGSKNSDYDNDYQILIWITKETVNSLMAERIVGYNE